MKNNTEIQTEAIGDATPSAASNGSNSDFRQHNNRNESVEIDEVKENEYLGYTLGSNSEDSMMISQTEELNGFEFVTKKMLENSLVLIERRLSGLEHRMDINENQLEIITQCMMQNYYADANTKKNKRGLNMMKKSIPVFGECAQMQVSFDQSMVGQQEYGNAEQIQQGSTEDEKESLKQMNEQDNVDYCARLDAIEARIEQESTFVQSIITQIEEAQFVELSRLLNEKTRSMETKFRRRMGKLDAKEAQLQHQSEQISLAFEQLKQTHVLVTSCDLMTSLRENLKADILQLSAQVSLDELRITEHAKALANIQGILKDLGEDLFEVIKSQKYISDSMDSCRIAVGELDILKKLYFISPTLNASYLSMTSTGAISSASTP